MPDVTPNQQAVSVPAEALGCRTGRFPFVSIVSEENRLHEPTGNHGEMPSSTILNVAKRDGSDPHARGGFGAAARDGKQPASQIDLTSHQNDPRACEHFDATVSNPAAEPIVNGER
jgi:hypothetical protein